jgi:DNA replication protein DnaC
MKDGDLSEKNLRLRLKVLKLPSFIASYEELARQAERDGWTHIEYVRRLVELEILERQQRRVERLRKGSGLPADKTLGALKTEKLPAKVRRQLPALCEGGFVHRAENVLAFGLPGRGKTHLLAAIGHELIQRGYAVLFTPAYRLVQRLLAAKRDLVLDRELKRLDAYDAVILDDLGYVQQDREEMEVLFTFLSQRYERRSVMITSNLVFSQWDQIFKNPLTTMAAIDRLVHHAIILEMAGPSVREEEAKAASRASAESRSPVPPEASL